MPNGFGIASNCPCGGAGWSGACFQPVDPAVAAINAMQLVIYMDPDDGIKPHFSAIFDSIGNSDLSTNGIELVSSATAALVPRRLLFLVDISPSIASDSHPDPNSRPYASSAFADTSLPAGPGYGIFTQDCLTDPWPGSEPAVLPAGQTRCQSFNAADVPGDLDADGDLVFTAPSFRLDNTIDPEPLKSVLTAAHHVMYDLRARAIGADRFGFIGFDEQILPLRATMAGANPALVEPSSAQFNDFFEATKVETNITYSDGNTDIGNISNLDDRFLFPRHYSGAFSFAPKNKGGSHRTLNSNLGGPLLTSLQAFASSSNGAQATSHAFLFTDGLSYCVTDMANHPFGPLAPRCLNGQPLLNTASLDEIIDEVVQEFEDREVSLHIFLAGIGVRPHTIVRKGDNGCLSEEDARTMAREGDLTGAGNAALTNNINYSNLAARNTTCLAPGPNDTCYPTGVDISNNPPHALNIYGAIDESINNPWTAPNLLYYAATRTGGLFVPLRPACNADDPSDTTHRMDLDASCRGAGGSIGTRLSEPDFRDLPVVSASGADIFPKYVDSEGRLLCDVENRSVAEQVSDAIGEILGQNPFLLVAEQ